MSFLTTALLGGGLLDPLRKGLKSATGLTDAQMLGAGALAAGGAIAAPMIGAGAGGSGLALGGASGTGLTLGGTGATGAGMVAGPGATLGTPSAAAGSGGLLSTYAQPAVMGLQAANMAHGLLQSPQIQGGQLPHSQGPDVSAFINAQAQQDAQLKQQRQARMQSLLGGTYGSA